MKDGKWKTLSRLEVNKSKVFFFIVAPWIFMHVEFTHQQMRFFILTFRRVMSTIVDVPHR